MGELSARELADDLVEAWRAAPEDGVALHEFMGLSVEEYAAWVKPGGSLPDDFERRHGN